MIQVNDSRLINPFKLKNNLFTAPFERRLKDFLIYVGISRKKGSSGTAWIVRQTFFPKHCIMRKRYTFLNLAVLLAK